MLEARFRRVEAVLICVSSRGVNKRLQTGNRKLVLTLYLLTRGRFKLPFYPGYLSIFKLIFLFYRNEELAQEVEIRDRRLEEQAEK